MPNINRLCQIAIEQAKKLPDYKIRIDEIATTFVQVMQFFKDPKIKEMIRNGEDILEICSQKCLDAAKIIFNAVKEFVTWLWDKICESYKWICGQTAEPESKQQETTPLIKSECQVTPLEKQLVKIKLDKYYLEQGYNLGMEKIIERIEQNGEGGSCLSSNCCYCWNSFFAPNEGRRLELKLQKQDFDLRKKIHDIAITVCEQEEQDIKSPTHFKMQ